MVGGISLVLGSNPGGGGIAVGGGAAGVVGGAGAGPGPDPSSPLKPDLMLPLQPPHQQSPPLLPPASSHANYLTGSGSVSSRGGGVVVGDHEQQLFERRLCDPDSEGIAVRKINQHGKSAIRYVRCIPLDPEYHQALLLHSNQNQPDGSTATANRSCSSSRSASGWSGTSGARSSSGASWGGGGATNSSSAAAVVVRSSSPMQQRGPAAAPPNHPVPPSSSHKGNYRQYVRVPSSDPHSTKADSPPNKQLLPPLPPPSSPSPPTHFVAPADAAACCALVWGKRKGIKVPLERFVAVRRGKVTPRSKRNAAPQSRILSLVTDDPEVHLDIEAPTKLDRDRFARAFGAFLRVPVLDGNDDPPPLHRQQVSPPPVPPVPTHLQWTRDSAPGNPVDTNNNEKVDVVVVVPNAAGNRLLAPAAQPPPSPPSHRPMLPPLAQSSSSAPLSASSTSSMPTPNALPEAASATAAPGDWKAAVAPLAVAPVPSAAQSRPAPRGDATAPLSSTSHIDDDDDDDDELEALDSPEPHGGEGPITTNAGPSAAVPATSERAPLPSQPREGSAAAPLDNDDASEQDDDASSAVSSLTGHHPHYDPELVEELHQALNDMRAQLEEARAEAARAVKVAEQAITSAERNASATSSHPPLAAAASSSSPGGDAAATQPSSSSTTSSPPSAAAAASWQNTVTHKAAEAAALAQKRCAEALARQRLAEERLEGERRTAQFWRKQAEVAEDEAGLLQTRVAQAEVQRAALQAQLDSERRVAARQWQGWNEGGGNKNTQAAATAALEAAMDRNRWLELELERTRRELEEREAELDARNRSQPRKGARLLLRGASDARLGPTLPKNGVTTSSGGSVARSDPSVTTEAPTSLDGQVAKLQAQAASVREEFELLRRATADQLSQFPQEARQWAEQVARALQTSLTETEHLRLLWAHEHASRRKLLHEVQDLRGRVRVYCRPRPDPTVREPLLSLASHDTVVFHRDRIEDAGAATDAFGGATLSFAFDRAFRPDVPQHDVYTEVEDVCLSVLEGYNVCLLAFGQTGTGKTHTLLGDIVAPEPGVVRIENRGIQLRALEQIFAIAEHRSDRYRDSFTLTLVEVFNERLTDLVAGTPLEVCGEVVLVAPDDKKSKKKSKDDDAPKQTKLEIRTDLQGETVVQGLLALEVSSYDHLCEIWDACIRHRRNRLREMGLDPIPYEAASHTITTLKVVSSNVATGIGTVGKIQFVDLGGADLVPRTFDVTSPKASIPHQNVFASITGDKSEWKFANRSLDTLNDVILARSEFTRSVPYRNSTLTHLLMDSLEHDTKVLVFACVSTDPKDAQETATTLRFATLLSKVTVGKATKHIVQPS